MLTVQKKATTAIEWVADAANLICSSPIGMQRCHLSRVPKFSGRGDFHSLLYRIKSEIWQLLDTQNIAWHAGKANAYSIGVEVCNPYYTKYNSYYRKKGLPERPIWTDKYVHGKKAQAFLGFYRSSNRCTCCIVEATSRACGIPLQVPPGAAEVHPAAAENKYNGFVCHYHLTPRKIDCAGLDMDLVLAKAKAIRGQ